MTRGEALFDRGDFDAALAEFEAAYEAIGEHPSRFLILYNIGQCHERRFRYDVALTYYRRYLAEGGSRADGHAEVEANVHALEGLLSTVSVETHAPNAEIYFDDRPLGAAPGEVHVPAGLHVVSVRAEGYVTAERSVAIPAAGHLALTLEPIRLSDEYRGISPAFAITFGGLALATLGVGIGFGVAAVDARAAYDRTFRENPWTLQQEDLDHLHSLAITADIFYGATAVLGLTGLVLGVMGDWSFGAQERDGATRSVALRIGPGALGIEGTW